MRVGRRVGPGPGRRSVSLSQPLYVTHCAHSVSHSPGLGATPHRHRCGSRGFGRGMRWVCSKPRSAWKSGDVGSSWSDSLQLPARGCQACGGSNRRADGRTDGEVRARVRCVTPGRGGIRWKGCESPQRRGQRQRSPWTPGASSLCLLPSKQSLPHNPRVFLEHLEG